jgi:hypothetical protein
MPFIQIIEMTTSKIDEIKKLDLEYEAATEGKSTVTRALVCADRDAPNKYFVIVEFPSYEAAMKNSELPETQHSPRSRWRSRMVRRPSTTST